MERYYSKSSKKTSRVRNNEELYKKIYEMGEYTNVEGITTIEKGSEIDISKIKELLQKGEQKPEKRTTSVTPKSEPIKVEVEEMDEDRNYDIRDILNKAKESKTDDNNKIRSLKNTEYDILKGLNLKKAPSDEEYDLKDLINTITHNSALNKLASAGDGDSLLDDLISKGKTDMIDTKSINAIINEEKKKYDNKDDEEMEIDKSFYTSNFNFKEDDFDAMVDLNNNLKKRNKLIKILIFFVFVIMVALIVLLVFTKWH